MFDWVKKIIEKRNSKAEKKAFKDSVYSDDNRSVIDSSTLDETEKENDTNVSAKKEVLSRAEKKRRKDLEKLEKMNSSMNSDINSLLGR